MRLLLWMLMIAVLLVLPVQAWAQGDYLTVDLTEDSVNITAGFDGARLSLFGVKEQEGDVAIVISGPARPMVVRRKSQVMGMWMNTDAVSFRNVPVYYDLALSSPENAIAMNAVREELDVGLDALAFQPAARYEADTVRKFREALIRNKQLQGHFPLEPRDVVFLNENFFRANFYMPPDVPTGEYAITTYLFNNGAVTSSRVTTLRVAQVGFNAGLYRFAHLNALAYGLVAVLLAIVAGGAGYVLWRKD